MRARFETVAMTHWNPVDCWCSAIAQWDIATGDRVRFVYATSADRVCSPYVFEITRILDYIALWRWTDRKRSMSMTAAMFTPMLRDALSSSRLYGWMEKGVSG